MPTQGVNKVILIGKLEDNPVVVDMPSGNAFAYFTLSTSEMPSLRDFEDIKDSHIVILTGRRSEVSSKTLRKGQLVYVEGKLHYIKCRDEYEHDQIMTTVVVNI